MLSYHCRFFSCARCTLHNNTLIAGRMWPAARGPLQPTLRSAGKLLALAILYFEQLFWQYGVFQPNKRLIIRPSVRPSICVSGLWWRRHHGYAQAAARVTLLLPHRFRDCERIVVYSSTWPKHALVPSTTATRERSSRNIIIIIIIIIINVQNCSLYTR